VGLGGNLIWTAVFKALNEAEGKPVLVAHKPLLSDLLCGRLYDSGVGLDADPVFKGNPRLQFTPVKPKNALARFLDLCFAFLIRPGPLQKAYELAVFAAAERLSRRRSWHLVHVNMLIHSYAASQRADHFVWKQGGHAIATIARRFTDRRPGLDCEIYFDATEETRVQDLLRVSGLRCPFIVLEPDTNRDWFGELRAWPFERWQALVDRLAAMMPDLQIVQIGLSQSQPLRGVIDLRGQTSFREAGLLMRESALFVGTEGGLVHAANAVKARAVIIWGGVTLPEFAGYADRHTILCNYVHCAPCGHLGWCDNGHICMNNIGTDSVLETVVGVLNQTIRPGVRSPL
jgi:hypothetical protein